MPNIGRPSRGCQECKVRKLKVYWHHTRSMLSYIHIKSSHSVTKGFQYAVVVKEMAGNAQATWQILMSCFETPCLFLEVPWERLRLRLLFLIPVSIGAFQRHSPMIGMVKPWPCSSRTMSLPHNHPLALVTFKLCQIYTPLKKRVRP